jgi:hypothetical protein
LLELGKNDAWIFEGLMQGLHLVAFLTNFLGDAARARLE